MPIIFEDTAQVSKKRINIPQKAKKTFQALKKIYKPYLDANVPGSKILKSLGSDNVYNKKGTESKANGKAKHNSISVNDAKVRLHRMQKLPKDSIEYQLNGGELAANIYRKGVESARGVKSVEAVTPPKPTSNNSIKPSVPQMKDITKNNGKISMQLTTEGIRGDEHLPIDDYLNEYSPSAILYEFLGDPKGKEDWYPLIDPSMYQKALDEFMRYGKISNFPTKYIYQWMGIIMRNTVKLSSNTELEGHKQHFPLDDFEDWVGSYLKDKDYYVNDDEITYEISISELKDLLKEYGLELNEEYGRHSDGQLDLFMNQSETDEYDIRKKNRDYQKKLNSKIFPLIKQFNEKSYHDNITFNDKNNKFYNTTSVMLFLDNIGLYDWMVLPDGSDAISDFGLEPLFRIIEEYKENSTPEETLVIINRALDVYHCRGDLSSAFIVGGRKSLSQISENNRQAKKIYITEEQLMKIKYGKYNSKRSNLP